MPQPRDAPLEYGPDPPVNTEVTRVQYLEAELQRQTEIATQYQGLYKAAREQGKAAQRQSKSLLQQVASLQQQMQTQQQHTAIVQNEYAQFQQVAHAQLNAHALRSHGRCGPMG